MPRILAFCRLRQKDCEFEGSLGCIVRLCLKKKKLLNSPKYPAMKSDKSRTGR
jgi:hypothetical protein